MDTPEEKAPETTETEPPAGRKPAVAPAEVHHVPEKGKRKGCWWLPLLLLFLFGGGALVLVVLVIAAAVAAASVPTGVGGDIVENIYDPGKPGGLGGDVPKVAVINLTGVIDGYGSHASGAGMVHVLAKQLRRAYDDENVKVVLLQVDSPGGSLTASDILWNEVKRLKERNKKVVVSVGSYAASGGYYIIAPADYIVAGPTSQVGSFGVIMEHVNVDDLLEKIGVDVRPIKSTGSKDIGSPFRDMTPEERAYFEKMLAHYHDRFVEIIVNGRQLAAEEVRDLATGKVYTADEALEYGLVDQVGYFDAALAQARTLSGHPDPQVVVYGKRLNLIDQLMNAEGGVNLNVLRKLLRSHESGRVEFKALWTGRLPR